MLPTVLRRWPWCYSYFLWLCGFYYRAFHVVLPCSLFSFFFFFSPVRHCDYRISLGEERAVLYASRAFILHTLISVFVFFPLVSVVGCGLWLWHCLDLYRVCSWTVIINVTLLMPCSRWLKQYSIFETTQNKFIDTRRTRKNNLHYDEVWGSEKENFWKQGNHTRYEYTKLGFTLYWEQSRRYSLIQKDQKI